MIAELEFDESLPSFPLLAVFVEWICNCALFIQCYLLSLPDSCQNKNIYTAVISERNDNNMRTTSWKREHIYSAVISKRNDSNIRTTSCKREHTQLPSVRGMITILEPLHVKENVYTQLSSVRGVITISELFYDVFLCNFHLLCNV